MARALALRLVDQIDREIALLRLVAQIVVAHEAVEVERRRRAGIGLDRGQLRQVLEPLGGGHQRAVGLLQRRSLRHVEHDLDFRLVVERQQLDAHVLGGEQRADGERSRGRRPGGRFASAAGRCSSGRGDLRVEPAERADVVRMALAVLDRCGVAAGDAQQQPRRDGDRDAEREQHRDRGVGRNRAHVGAHHAADEHHRQQRGDDGQGRDDGRIADLGDRLDRGLDQAALAAHRPMPGDVLDHDDRVVDQNADREDQREQADAVDRVAHQPRGEHRQQDGGGDDDEHHHAFAPADRQRDQDDDRQRGEAEMEQQLVGLLGRGRAVVAGDRDFEAGRNDAALDDLEAAAARRPPPRRRWRPCAWRSPG